MLVLLCDDDYDDDDDIHTQDGSLEIRHSLGMACACYEFINKQSECNQRPPNIVYRLISASIDSSEKHLHNSGLEYFVVVVLVKC